MNTAPSSPRAASLAAGTDPRHDVVPGIPPVPITIWRTPYQQTDTHPYPSALAERIVTTFSRPGDTVADLTGGQPLEGPCTAGGRAYVAAGPEPVTLAAAAASLVVVDWADVAGRADGETSAGALLRAVRRTLRPGGHLVVLTPATAGAGPAARHLVAGCLGTGLTYLQNIIALRADIKTGRLVAHRIDVAASNGDQVVKVHADLFVFAAPAAGGVA